MQIETADVERQFGLQHPEEAADMLGALGEGVGGEPQAAVPQFGHCLCAGLVPRSQIKTVAGGTFLEDGSVGADQPIARVPERPPQDVVHALESLSQLRADQHGSKLEPVQMSVDDREIVVVKLRRQSREEFS